MRAIIVGAGIGGLATALALDKAGLEVKLYERSEALQEFGAGVQLAPNATRVLSALGVLEAVQAVAARPESIRVFRGMDEQLLARVRIDDAVRRWGAPYLVIHRADLQRVLADGAQRSRNVEFEFGATLVAVADRDKRVSIGLRRDTDSREDYADLLIAADGLHSHIRRHFGFGPGDHPVFTGQVAYRAIIDANNIDARWAGEEVCLGLGPGAHLVLYPLRVGSVLNIVAVIESNWNTLPDDTPSGDAVDRAALDRAFAGWSKATRRLLAAGTSWRARPIFVRPPIASFSRGAIALVGDAAHPMAPFLAQGAAQAIEDAAALAHVFCRHQGVNEALRAYSRKRVARATRVQISALRQGRLYHLDGKFAAARDAMIRLTGSEGLRIGYDWLYGDRSGPGSLYTAP